MLAVGRLVAVAAVAVAARWLLSAAAVVVSTEAVWGRACSCWRYRLPIRTP